MPCRTVHASSPSIIPSAEEIQALYLTVAEIVRQENANHLSTVVPDDCAGLPVDDGTVPFTDWPT